jgi:serine/threonine-protein kinase
MGEVYRARDTRLDREVAIKISAEKFGDRFEREARAVAALNHPNICTLHDIGSNYLVMELVEGPTLAERITAGAIPVDEALPIARQIAEALETAHERGIVHRDLKPANVKITHDGSVKVLDFGLAAILQRGSASDSRDPADSPTLTMTGTLAGTILGTAAYMSPEQAKGKKVDRRSDIWSFGAVLYEMLCGKRAFGGETVPEILAAVITAEPNFGKLSAAVPASIRRLLRRSLTKDPRKRLQAIGEARVAIEDVLGGVSTEDAVPPATVERPRSLWVLPWALAGVLAVALVVSLWGRLHPATTDPRPVMRYSMMLPNVSRITGIKVSRDGARLAYRGLTGPIYVRSIDRLDSQPLAGTEGSDNFFFSPDGQWIGFLLDGKLRKIPVSGGNSVPIADLAGSPYRILWLADDHIAFTKNEALMTVSASGGKPEIVLARDEKSRRGDAYSVQDLLPDGRNMLLIPRASGVEDMPLSVLDMQTGRQKVLVNLAGWAGYVRTSRDKGHIIYRSGETLFASPFDLARLEMTGSPVPVVERVGRWQATVLAEFSDSGLLVYVPATAQTEEQRTLVWVDRKGSTQPVHAPPHAYVGPRISPDGQRVAVQMQASANGQIGVIDLQRGTLMQVTFQGHNVRPVWTADGKGLAYRSNGSGGTGIFTVPADGSGPPVLLTTENNLGIAHSWSPDGKLLLGGTNGGHSFWLYSVRPDGSGGEMKTLPDSPMHKREAIISPDGHWVAYESDGTGQYEIYVQSFPDMKQRTTISADGGVSPRWRRDSRELFYRNGEAMMAAEIQTSPVFRAGVPKKLFEGHYSGSGYDVSPDGKNFLMVKPGPERPLQNTELHVVVNWFEDVRRLSPGRR